MTYASFRRFLRRWVTPVLIVGGIALQAVPCQHPGAHHDRPAGHVLM